MARLIFDLTTNASGAQTVTRANVSGLFSNYYILPVDTDSGLDITCKVVTPYGTATRDETLFSRTNVASAVRAAVTVKAQDSAGDDTVDVPISLADDTLEITLAQGGNAKRVVVILYLE